MPPVPLPEPGSTATWSLIGTRACTLARSRPRSCFQTAPELNRDDYTNTDHDSGPGPFLFVDGMRYYTESGVIGPPPFTIPAKGKTVLASLTDSFPLHFAALGEQP